MKVLDNLRYQREYHVAADNSTATVTANMRHRELYEALGLDPKKHLPDAGLPPTMVGNVQVWVMKRIPGTNQDAKRVWCNCPHCGRAVTAGKLPQHMAVHR